MGVADPKLGGVIQEILEIPCQSGGVVNEVLRGVRLYFHRLIKGLTAPAAAKAQLGIIYMYMFMYIYDFQFTYMYSLYIHTCMIYSASQ